MESRGREGTLVGAWSARRSWIAVLAAIASCLALAAPASAVLPSFTWTGQGGFFQEEWSAKANWAGGAAPSEGESIGTLEFPRLETTGCLEEGTEHTCYFSIDDLSGLSAETLKLDDSAGYFIAGRPLTLGEGGLQASPSAGPGRGGDFVELPITLSAPQKWTLAGRAGGSIGENGIYMANELSAPTTDSLAVEVSNEAALYLEGDSEVGPLTIEGANPNVAGVFNGYVGLLSGAMNAIDEQPVHLSHILLLGSGEIGNLESTGATINPSTGGEGITGELQVASAKLDAQSEMHFEVSKEGIVPGKSYSQMTSTGAIQLGGAKIGVRVGRNCPTLTAGETFTFVSTTGELGGVYGNAPESGPEVPIEFAHESACEARSQKIKIRYQRTGATKTVTGTVEAEAIEKQTQAREAEEREVTEGREAKARLETLEAKQRQEAAAGGVLASKTVSPDAKLASTSLKVNNAGAFTIKVSCPKGVTNCKGTVTLRTLGASGAAFDSAITTLASGSFSVAGGRSKTVVLHLSRKGRALLRAKRSLRARATIVAHDTAGGSHTTLAVVTLHGLGHG